MGSATAACHWFLRSDRSEIGHVVRLGVVVMPLLTIVAVYAKAMDLQ